MPEIKRIFQAGKMNRNLDDRLVPNGEYREALNINVNKSDSSDVGAAENVLGNVQIGNTNITNGECIGSFRDQGNEKIYFFVTNNRDNAEANPSTATHGVFEFDQRTGIITRLATGLWLNFHVNFLITGINFVDGLLFWTDNRNEPRKINVDRARNDGTYYNSDNRAAVAKFAPFTPPTITRIDTSISAGSNFLEDKLPRFAYRYKFDDGEYSTISPLTPIAFTSIAQGTPSNGEISGFINQARQVFLSTVVPTGYGISGIEFLYNESTTSNIYILDDISVSDSGSDVTIDYTYSGQDPFRTLPGNQLTRVYDAVPRKALAQEFAGGRIIYGNYLQNYNVPSISFTVNVQDKALDTNDVLNRFSVKSNRTYQVGIVLADRFGRQSPVILSSTGGDTVFVNAGTGPNAMQRLQITINTELPSWAHSYRVVVKQREQEYYNWFTTVNTATPSQFSISNGDINKVPRDTTQETIIGGSGSISQSIVKVYPKVLNRANVLQDTQYSVASLTYEDANITSTIPGVTGTTNGDPVYFETIPRESELDIFYETSTGGLVSGISGTIDIEFWNCWILNTGAGDRDPHLELNRIRAGFNEPFFTVGLKAYVVQENFVEQRRFNTLIHSSGLFNSRVGVNYINQFNEAEGGITVSLDPADGSVQKLYAEDTQLLIFQEDKISRSPIDKDFIYSAEGGAVPVTSSTQYLGTIAPFAGEYGISQNPESFAIYGTRKYLSDKNRGVVLRLSNNGITEISQYGLSDFFRDALRGSSKVIGSYDEYHDHYNITIVGTNAYSGQEDTNVATASQGYFTVSFEDEANGWPSFKSFQQEGGLTLNNRYYTFNAGNLWQHDSGTVYNRFYGVQNTSYLECVLNDSPSDVKEFKTINYEGDRDWVCDTVETEQDSLRITPDSRSLAILTTQSLNVSLTGTNDEGDVVRLTDSNVLRTETQQVVRGGAYNWTIKVVPSSTTHRFTTANNVTFTLPAALQNTGQPVYNAAENAIYYTTASLPANADNTHAITITGGAVEDISGSILTINLLNDLTAAGATPGSTITDPLIQVNIPTSGLFASAFRAGPTTYAYDVGDTNTDVEIEFSLSEANAVNYEFNLLNRAQIVESSSIASLVGNFSTRTIYNDRAALGMRAAVTLPDATRFGTLTIGNPTSGDIIRYRPRADFNLAAQTTGASALPTGATMQIGFWNGTANTVWNGTDEEIVIGGGGSGANAMPSILGNLATRQLYVYPDTGHIWLRRLLGSSLSFNADTGYNVSSSTLTRVTSTNLPAGSPYLGGFRVQLQSNDYAYNPTRAAVDPTVINSVINFVAANVVAIGEHRFTLDNGGTDETTIINGGAGTITMSRADTITLQGGLNIWDYSFYLTNAAGTADQGGFTMVAGGTTYAASTIADEDGGGQVPALTEVTFTFGTVADLPNGTYRLYLNPIVHDYTTYQTLYRGDEQPGSRFVNITITA